MSANRLPLTGTLRDIQPADISEIPHDYPADKTAADAMKFTQWVFNKALGDWFVYGDYLTEYGALGKITCEFSDDGEAGCVIFRFTVDTVPFVVEAKPHWAMHDGWNRHDELISWYIQAGESGEFGELANIATRNLKARLLTAIKFALVSSTDD